MARRRRPLACAALAAAAGLALSGCDLARLGSVQYQKDNRVTITSPKARTEVTVPLTIRWTVKDFPITGQDGSTSSTAGVFGVFVDQAPIKVGQSLQDVGGSGKSCRQDPRCPTASYLADRNVYVTTEPELTLDLLPRVADGAGDEQHEVTIVLLDGSGVRHLESAWYSDFTFPRRSS